jgi:sec-independent protein translocase protein TatA
MPGISEWVIILVVLLIVFGVGKLPQIGDGLGKGIKNFRRAVSGKDEIDVTPTPAQVGDQEPDEKAQGELPRNASAKQENGA